MDLQYHLLRLSLKTRTVHMSHLIFLMEAEEPCSLPLNTVTGDCHCQPPRQGDQANFPIMYCP